MDEFNFAKSETQEKPPIQFFKPLGKSLRSSQVLANEIRKFIVQGKIKPGQRLPSERDLAQSFQVTRATVREALRSLEQVRLVSVHHGRGIRVLDYLTSTGIEFVADLLMGADRDVHGLMKDIADAWWVIGRAMMFFAVEKFRKEDHEWLLESVLAYIHASDAGNTDARTLQVLDFEVQNRLMHSTQNQAMILLHNSMRHIYSNVADLFEPIVDNPEFIAGLYTKLIYALDKGDVKAAKKVFADYFDHGREALSRSGKV